MNVSLLFKIMFSWAFLKSLSMGESHPESGVLKAYEKEELEVREWFAITSWCSLPVVQAQYQGQPWCSTTVTNTSSHYRFISLLPLGCTHHTNLPLDSSCLSQLDSTNYSKIQCVLYHLGIWQETSHYPKWLSWIDSSLLDAYIDGIYG